LYPNYDGSFNGRPNGVARWVRKPKIDGLGRDEEVSVLYDDDDDDDSDDDTTILTHPFVFESQAIQTSPQDGQCR